MGVDRGFTHELASGLTQASAGISQRLGMFRMIWEFWRRRARSGNDIFSWFLGTLSFGAGHGMNSGAKKRRGATL